MEIDPAPDQPEAVLDIENHEQLRAYLIDRGYIRDNEAVVIQNLSGGVSNRTVLVENAMGVSWVIKQSLAKLRVQVDWYSDPNRIHREALGLHWLPEFVPDGTIPALIFEDESTHVLGMAAVPAPHRNWKAMLLNGTVDMHHVSQFGQILGGIHRGAYLKREAVQPVFADQSFFESLRLEPYYLYTAKQHPSTKDFFYSLTNATRANAHTLVHGDYSPKNILVYQDRLVLLDYEVIHFGDPAFDLGFSLTHLLSKAHHLADHQLIFASAVALYWHTYLETIGDVPWRAELEGRTVRHTLACLLARVSGRSPLEYL
ncbi:MAG: phosphotransferase family protein, partial [Aggregatilineales bacterium]